MKNPRRCMIDGCSGVYFAKSKCRIHYYRGRARPNRAGRTCTVEGCSRDHMARGMCKTHYEAKALAEGRRQRKVCTVEACGRAHLAHGFCRGHYRRNRLGLDMTLPFRRPNGQGYIGPSGYVQLCVNGKKDLAHRHVMAAHLGRDLYPHENVHHINGDRSDNRLENLELWNTSQPAGQRVADKLAWAREILAQYEGDEAFAEATAFTASIDYGGKPAQVH